MLRRRTVTVLCAALLLSLIPPTAALAQEEPDVISSPTIVSAVVDMQTGIATLTISVTCLMDVGYQVRGEGTLSQSYGSGRFAWSYQGGFGGSTCQAGDVLTIRARFPSPLDKFVPGPAEIDAWLEAQVVCCHSDDFEDIPTPVMLRPASQ